jgi:hypothetical protein
MRSATAGGEVIFAGGPPVDRHRLDVEVGRELAQAELVGAVAVDQVEGGDEHMVAGHVGRATPDWLLEPRRRAERALVAVVAEVLRAGGQRDPATGRRPGRRRAQAFTGG